ncbi:DNA-binding response regulator [Paenibacillus sp. CAA11]|uniref:LytR/AlgR family response regulator transcription factor n=1 Tax=Paenibacillus sp. CAA11 TaxID=1532905 RepID=UPI000D3D659E|nr:LytTR family DNA-binding domain-containing protein [Paenibacillus sp. CAA11]AWB43764.1 DNA-binding response regulator [Paenibacillus sp. CAA11]
MLRIAICDDEAAYLARYKELLLKFEMHTDYTFHTEVFSTGEALLEYYEQHRENSFHILLLDIEMPGLSGLETARRIRQLPDHDVSIVFLTGYPEYVLDSFDVQASQYLIKPVDYELFEQKMNMLCGHIMSSNSRFLVVKSSGETRAIKCSDIICIENAKGRNKGCLAITTCSSRYTVRDTLRSITDKLPEQFVTIHRSAIVNMAHIRRFTAELVEMSDGSVIPVGRSKLQHFKTSYTGYLIKEFKAYG